MEKEDDKRSYISFPGAETLPLVIPGLHCCFKSGKGYIDDNHRNPNNNDRDPTCGDNIHRIGVSDATSSKWFPIGPKC